MASQPERKMLYSGTRTKQVRFMSAEPTSANFPPHAATTPFSSQARKRRSFDFFKSNDSLPTMDIDASPVMNPVPVSVRVPAKSGRTPRAFNFFKDVDTSRPATQTSSTASRPSSTPGSTTSTTLGSATSTILPHIPATPQTPCSRKRRRHAADFFRTTEVIGPAAQSSSSVTHAAASPQPNSTPAAASTSITTPHIPSDSQPIASSSRPVKKLPARSRMQQTQDQGSIDMRDLSPPPSGSHYLGYVFNTHDTLSTRQEIGSWNGRRNPDDLIVSRVELHAEQVELDRSLPEEMRTSTFYPSFAISPRELESLHGYLMSRYEIRDHEDYLHLLALYRNTRAIEAHKARIRFTELNEAVGSLAKVRLELIKAMKDRHSCP